MCLYCHNCYNSASDNVVHRLCTYLEMQWLRVGMLAGRAVRERQFTLVGEGRYVNRQGSVHWKGVYSVGKCALGMKIF